MTSDFASEVAKYPKNPQIAQNGDLGNNAWYARNFVALIGNRIWRQILHRKWLTSPNVAPNPKVVQNSVRAYCLALLSDAACLVIKRCLVNWLEFFIVTTKTAINLSEDDDAALADNVCSWRQADSMPDACQLTTRHCCLHPSCQIVVVTASQHHCCQQQQQPSI